MKITAKLELGPMSEILAKRNLEMGGAVQWFIDSGVLRLCEPRVPLDNGVLIKSGTINTVIGSGQVEYDTPYARRWYYEPADFQGAPTRGNYWFERAMKEGGADEILEGACKIAGARKG